VTVVRKLSVVLSVLVLAVTFGSMTASAQTGIALSTSSTSGIAFTPECHGNLSMKTDVSGSAAGLGGLLGSTGFYSLSGAPIALALGPSFSPIFADYTASGTLNFEITSMPGGLGTPLLMGTLTLVDLVQITTTGMTNTSGIADLTLTGGSLESAYPGKTGISQLTINLAGLGFLPSLKGAKSTKLGGATLDALPTPEPWSMLLYGSGLVVIGFVLRRRLPRVRIVVRN
jgi:hypothetical protein